ncbi:GNAT family N-acetyltransferase [Lichenihabitans sp. PAMC28606]|uniref:GNAT family N-acetyltransferase n=1 Tax=Lichenihabitans sp. PAMC28606 TaxID=2880932 RepID=UPI001D0AEC0E|nr:GNAT family N-acetyltransferase [Lichenihabitans sp. PAMC28606]UDL94852.1 GNAT family N-acetyltransferase [Lichenihabitans sp. PAMC28606]
MIDNATIRSIEECGFNAWPAKTTVLSGGWLLRLHDGYTKRANSANAWSPGPDFEAVRRDAETLYRRHGLPVVFRLTPLADPSLDEHLDHAGYTRVDPTIVMTKRLDRVVADLDPMIRLETKASPHWLESVAEATAIPAAFRLSHDALISNIQRQTVFATILAEDAQPIGYGLAVIEGERIGLFELVVHPAWRGRKLGERLVSALMAWGAAQGAASAYLQVGADNIAACRLYRRIGFSDAYPYHYRVLS